MMFSRKANTLNHLMKNQKMLRDSHMSSHLNWPVIVNLKKFKDKLTLLAMRILRANSKKVKSQWHNLLNKMTIKAVLSQSNLKYQFSNQTKRVDLLQNLLPRPLMLTNPNTLATKFPTSSLNPQQTNLSLKRIEYLRRHSKQSPLSVKEALSSETTSNSVSLSTKAKACRSRALWSKF